MSFTNLGYLLVFLPVVVLLYYFPLGRGKIGFYKQKAVLILASLAFYCLGSNLYSIFLILFTSFLNFALIRLGLRMKKGRILYAAAIFYDAAILVGFKYLNYLLPVFHIEGSYPMPLGLSYFTFMAVTYVVDSAKEKRKSSFLDTLLYLSFFCTVSAGPITQYRDFSGQIQQKSFNFDSFSVGINRFAVGLIKKVAIADVLCFLVEKCFIAPQLSVCMAWLGAVAYAVQIYFDFSGYSDMAIGTAQVLGYTLAENFRYPYAASSISEFWKRWHISLTRFFTNYIYIPLGGNRVSKGRHIFNLFVVWLITGLWHGNHLTFLVWAMIHFAVQLLEKNMDLKKIPKPIGYLYTATVVLVGWCFFRADSMSSALHYVLSLIGVGTLGFWDAGVLTAVKSYFLPLMLGCVFCFPIGNLRIFQGTVPQVLKQVCLVLFFILTLLSMFAVTTLAPLYGGF